MKLFNDIMCHPCLDQIGMARNYPNPARLSIEALEPTKKCFTMQGHNAGKSNKQIDGKSNEQNKQAAHLVSLASL